MNEYIINKDIDLTGYPEMKVDADIIDKTDHDFIFFRKTKLIESTGLFTHEIVAVISRNHIMTIQKAEPDNSSPNPEPDKSNHSRL